MNDARGVTLTCVDEEYPQSKPWQLVGTAIPGGEDTPCRGRVILFEVLWEAHEGGTRWKGRVSCIREARMVGTGGSCEPRLAAHAPRHQRCTL